MNKIFFMVLAALSILAGNISAEITTNIIVVSPFASEDQLKLAWQNIQGLALQQAPEGSLVVVVDGWELKVVGDLKIPRSHNQKFRFQTLSRDLTYIRQWFAEAVQSKSPLRTTGALRLTELADVLQRYASAQTSVTLVGSPLVLIPAEPEFSFYDPAAVPRKYVYPSDQHVREDRLRSPYGLAGREEQLKGLWIHFAYSDEDIFVTPILKQQVRRWWALYFSVLGAHVLSFGSDMGQVFADAYKTDLPTIQAEFNPRATELKMLSANRTENAELAAKRVNVILILDITSSMGERFAEVARAISLMREDRRYLLLTVSDHEYPHPVTAFEESDRPSDLARALRAIKLENGGDAPEALEDGLAVAAREIKERRASSVDVLVFSDSTPHAPADCPHAYDAGAEITKLLQAGHHVTLITCQPKQSTDWVPAGVSVKSLTDPIQLR